MDSWRQLCPHASHSPLHPLLQLAQPLLTNHLRQLLQLLHLVRNPRQPFGVDFPLFGVTGFDLCFLEFVEMVPLGLGCAGPDFDQAGVAVFAQGAQELYVVRCRGIKCQNQQYAIV